MTLMEIMVAVGILTLMTSLIWVSFSQSLRTQNVVRQSEERYLAGLRRLGVPFDHLELGLLKVRPELPKTIIGKLSKKELVEEERRKYEASKTQAKAS